MKIKTKKFSYDEAISMPREKHRDPSRQSFFLSALIRLLSLNELKKTHFTFTKERMEAAGDGPWLILMNHSCFLDLQIVNRLMFPRRYSIVCTSDGFVGKKLLMRKLGCIPTKKFITDITLMNDIAYALEKKEQSVLMYPEASYSFDGCATPLPRHLGVLLKKLNVPVVSIHTTGAFSYDPLYNGLQKRKVDVNAVMKCLISTDEIKSMTTKELDAVLDREFTFDNFAWQRDNKVEITEPFRADGLDRILYKCADCGAEGETEGKGTRFTCRSCGAEYELDVYGQMRPLNEKAFGKLSHIPDWYRWQRECVRSQIEAGEYLLDTEVDIGLMVDYKAIYMVGAGRLTHDKNGFTLTGEDGRILHTQKAMSSYSLYSDYFWYEIGDVICIGDNDKLFYCFPKKRNVVAKTRIAAEEMYKLRRSINV